MAEFVEDQQEEVSKTVVDLKKDKAEFMYEFEGRMSVI